MALLPKIRSVFGRRASDDGVDSVAVSTVVDEKNEANRQDPIVEGNEKNSQDPAIGTTGTDSNDELQGELPTQDAQRGVHDVEAVTLTWTKTTLVAVFLKYVAIHTADYLWQGPSNSARQQHLVTLLCQRIPIVDSLQLASLCHERIRVAFAAECHLHCRKRYVGRNVYSTVKSYGCLGSCPRLPYHGFLRYVGLDSYGYVP